MFIYPTTTCYFCGKNLIFNSSRMEYLCPDKNCSEENKYWVQEDLNQVGFIVGEWHFEFYKNIGYQIEVTELTNAKRRIYIQVPSILKVDRSNYLDVVCRVEKLQLFK